MKSFRLQIEGRRDLLLSLLGLTLGAVVIIAAAKVGWLTGVIRAIFLLVGAVFAGLLCRGSVSHGLRTRYPGARWIPVLAVGMSILTFGLVAKFFVPDQMENGFILAYILPAGACIGSFVFVNRHNPEVLK